MIGRRLLDFVESMSMTSQGLAAIGGFLGILAVGTVGFHYLERDWNWVEAFYFSTYTLTTVGYGDYVPSNDVSRLCASIYMIVGVTIALAALAVIGSNYISRREDTIIKKYEDAKRKKRESAGEQGDASGRTDDDQGEA